MENTNLEVSKAPLVVSIIFTSINTIFFILYTWMCIAAWPIAFNPDRGPEGLGLAFALIFMLIYGIGILIFSAVSIPTALCYNKKTKGSIFAKILIMLNTSYISIAAIVFAIVVTKSKS